MGYTEIIIMIKQKKKLQRHQSALRKNQGEDGYVKKRQSNVSINILSLIY